MADQKISELTALTGANVADDDAIAIVDTSATETKKIVFSELKNALDTATGFVRITGDTMTGNLNMGDNVKAIFGAGSDLQIYHTGSDSWIKDNGTGNLYLDTNGSGINISYNNSNENMATFTANGAATLYYDNAAKLATTSTGVDITGNDATNNGLTNLLTLSHTTTGTAGDGIGTRIVFEAEDDGGTASTMGYIDTLFTDVSDGAEKSAFAFSTRNGGSIAEAMRIDSSGHAIIPAGVTLGTSAGVYAAANTLDDYEEGTWTPATYGASTATISSVEGLYTKIGNMVYASFTFNVDTNSDSAHLRIHGLPFTVGSSQAARGGVIIGYQNSGTACVGNGVNSATRFSFSTLSGSDVLFSTFSNKVLRGVYVYSV